MDIADKYMHTLAADPDLDEQREGGSDKYKYGVWFPAAAKVDSDKDTASETPLDMDVFWQDNPVNEVSWPKDMSSSEREVLHTCLDLLSRGGVVVVNGVGIWMREAEYLDDRYGWALAFSKDETAGVTRETIRKFIFEHIDDYDQGKKCLDGLRSSRWHIGLR